MYLLNIGNQNFFKKIKNLDRNFSKSSDIIKAGKGGNTFHYLPLLKLACKNFPLVFMVKGDNLLMFVFCYLRLREITFLCLSFVIYG